MYDHKQLRQYVLKPVLSELGLWCQNSEEILILTCAQESKGGTYIHQLGNGPALGAYGMEQRTHDDIWTNFILNHPYPNRNGYNIEKILSEMGYNNKYHDASLMMTDIAYASIMCRIHYLRVKEQIPDSLDIDGLAYYWKRYYNTETGKGTTEQAIKSYLQFVGHQ